MENEPNNKEMPFLDHLEELRWNIIRSLIGIVVGVIVCLIFSDFILEFLKLPSKRLEPPLPLQFLRVQAIFIVKLEIGFFGGLILALPYVLAQIYKFVAPALLPQEKRYLIPVLAFATLLFLGGLAFAYVIILPFALEFFVGLATEDIKPDISIDQYIGFVLRLCFLFGIVFELPVVSFFLAQIGILTERFMRTYRRHAIIGIFVLAAVFTPPDPFTQVLLAIPLILLYEFSIFIVKAIEKRRARKELEEDQRYDDLLENS